MRKTMFGARINHELSHRPEDAIGHKENLFNFAMSTKIDGLDSWREYFIKRDIPFIFVIRKYPRGIKATRYFKAFAILKRQFIWNHTIEQFIVKGCGCNSIESETCPMCKPQYDYKYKRGISK